MKGGWTSVAPGADEAEECQLAAADCWQIWADRAQAVVLCHCSQLDPPGSAGLHGNNQAVQTEAAAAMTHHRHAQHAGGGC